jgi:hypothetical protein
MFFILTTVNITTITAVRTSHVKAALASLGHIYIYIYI